MKINIRVYIHAVLLVVFLSLSIGCSLPSDNSGYWKQEIDLEAYGLYTVSPTYGVLGIGYLRWKRNVDKEPSITINRVDTYWWSDICPNWICNFVSTTLK